MITSTDACKWETHINENTTRRGRNRKNKLILDHYLRAGFR
jgi:hypothetical protein